MDGDTGQQQEVDTIHMSESTEAAELSLSNDESELTTVNDNSEVLSGEDDINDNSNQNLSSTDEEKREPVKIHIKLSDLKRFHTKSNAFTKKRKPKWYCYQCRITFFARCHLDKHLKEHVKEARTKVKLVRLPLPDEVVARATKRYREAEIIEKAILQVAKELSESLVAADQLLISAPISTSPPPPPPPLFPSDQSLLPTPVQPSISPIPQLTSITPVPPPLPELEISTPASIEIEKIEVSVTPKVSSPNIKSLSTPIVPDITIEPLPLTCKDPVPATETPKSVREFVISQCEVKSTPRNMEPERCESVMILENESNIVKSISSVSNLNSSVAAGLDAVKQSDPSRLFAGMNQTPAVQTVPTSRKPPLWNGGDNHVMNSSISQRTPHIQDVVSLANHHQQQHQLASKVTQVTKRHVSEDPDSSCCCMMCMEVRCGDLLKHSQVSQTDGVPCYQCPVCSVRFNQKNHLLRHCRVSRHCFLCELCGSGFFTQSLYHLHIKLHQAKQMQSSAARGYTNPINNSSSSGGSIIPANSQRLVNHLNNSGHALAPPNVSCSLPNILRSSPAMNGVSSSRTLANQLPNKNLAQQLSRTNEMSHDDDIVVLGEKWQTAAQKQRASLQQQIAAAFSNVVGKSSAPPPPQLSRILHNSEITLTPISNVSMPPNTNSLNKTAPVNTQQISTLNNNRRVNPQPPVPNTSIVGTQSVADKQSELRKLMSAYSNSIGTPVSSDVQPTRPILPKSNVYRMMPVTKGTTSALGGQLQSSAITSTPTWHHPVQTTSSTTTNVIRAPVSLINGLRYSAPTNAVATLHNLQVGRPAAPQAVPSLFKTPNVTKFPRIAPGPAPSTIPGPPKLVPYTPSSNNNNNSNSNAEVFRGPPNITPVRCHVCNLLFNSIVNFQVHFDSVHKSQRASQVYKCGKCSKTYTQHGQFCRHEASCKEKVFCKKCNKLCYRSDLITHYTQAHMGANVELAITPSQRFTKPTSVSGTISPVNVNTNSHANDSVEIISVNNNATNLTSSVTISPIMVDVEQENQQTSDDLENTIKAIEISSVTSLAGLEKLVDDVPVELLKDAEEISETESSLSTVDPINIVENTVEDKEEVSSQDAIECENNVDHEENQAEEKTEENEIIETSCETVQENLEEKQVEVNEPTPEAEQNVPSCPVCDLIFENQEALQLHLRQHCDINIKICKCIFCQKEFETRKLLSKHLRTHFSSCKNSPPRHVSAAKRPRLLPLEAAKQIEGLQPRLAVAVLDVNKMAASVEILKRLGVVGFLSFDELIS